MLRPLVQFILLVFPLLALALLTDTMQVRSLPALKGDPQKASVSGFSSGAYMAVQYEVAFSASVVGAGIIAGAILRQIYGDLNPPANSPTGKIVLFDQKEFAAKAKMAPEGYVYIPQSCASGASCAVHVAFHGCLQSAKSVGDKFYNHAGYNRRADTNNLIVLYPQVNASSTNVDGCWDWFGYTGKNYATKAASQLSAVNAMVNRLVSGR